MADEDHYWVVGCVIGRRERAAVKFLEKRGVEAYVPLGHRMVRRVRRRHRCIEVAFVVYSGYVFVKIPAGARLEEARAWAMVARCPTIAGVILMARGDADPVPYRLAEREIARLRGIEASGGFDGWRDGQGIAFPEGTPVRVVAGLLAGLGGKVVHMVGRSRLKVEAAGRTWELDIDNVQPLAL